MADDAVPPPPPARRRRPRRWRLALALLALAALWLLRAPILTAMARALAVRDPLRKADAIFVFGGDAQVRPIRAAELWRQGWAPRVLVPEMEIQKSAPGPTQTEKFTIILHKGGVPDSAVAVLRMPGGTKSTTDDVAVLRAWLRRTGARRVIAVTTDYHTRRARASLRRGLRGMGVRVTMVGVRARAFSETDWWTTPWGRKAYLSEYAKIARDVLTGR
ncbi:MAG TPA: YdcF family protein [Longimicrobiaceae bacterium]